MDPLLAKALVDGLSVDPFGHRPRAPRPPRRARQQVRQRTARMLRSWADRVEPRRTVPACR